MHNYHQQTQHTFINALLVSGENLSSKTACIIGRAIADWLPLEGFNSNTDAANDAIASINAHLGFDIVLTQEKVNEYYNNRHRVAFKAILPLSAESAKYWAVGGTQNISPEEHKIWEDVETLHLYNEFRKLLLSGE